MSNFDGPDRDVPGIDEAIDEDWRRFTRQLADRLATNPVDTGFSLHPSFVPEGSTAQRMLLTTTSNGTVMCAASGLQSAPSPWRSSAAESIHTLEEPVAWVDRFAATIVSAVRGIWDVPHPSFLTCGDARSPGVETRMSAGDFVTPRVAADSTELVAAVDCLLQNSFGVVEKAHSRDGFCLTIDTATVYVHVASVEEIRLHTCVVERIAGRTRAAEVVADLNRQYPQVKLLLVEDRIHATITVDACPFIPQHVINGLQRLSTFVSGVDDSFAENVGGTVAAPDDPSVWDESIHIDGEDDVPPQLMRLLEVDAESGGGLDPTDIVAVCGADRDAIVRYAKFCAEQATAWRDYARDARLRGEPGAVEEGEIEALPWDRVVCALQLALRTVGFLDNA
mgnify:FL=1